MMSKASSRTALFVAIVTTATVAFAITAGQIDDFENSTTMGWSEGASSSNPPSNIATGGPQGVNDNFLRNISSGNPGPGGKMVMFNRVQWSGNYNAEKIQSIRMFVTNLGNSALQIRIAIQGGANTWYSSTTGFALPPDGVWREAIFNLNADEMTRVEGSSSIDSVLDGVSELRILSDTSPDLRGETIAGTLGVDDIEAVAKVAVPDEFVSLHSFADVNGNNKTDIGVLLRVADTGVNKAYIMDGGSGNNIRTVSFGPEQARGFTTVPDATGDMIPEFAVLLQGSLFARVKEVATGTKLGTPKYNAKFTPVALLAVGDAGGGVGPDLAVVGRNESTEQVQAQVRDVPSGSTVSRFNFSKVFVPFDAVVVDNVGGSAARDIAVLGIDASGNIQVQVKDALSGKQISKFNFDKTFTPLAFIAVPNAAGKLKHLAVLGRNSSGVIRAQVKRAGDGVSVGKVKFSKAFEPTAFLAFADSNSSGGSEITVVGVDGSGKVRAQTKEIANGAAVTNINFNASYPPVDAIAVNGVAGTGQNEIVVLGQNAAGEFRLQVKDLLTGNQVKNISVP